MITLLPRIDTKICSECGPVYNQWTHAAPILQFRMSSLYLQNVFRYHWASCKVYCGEKGEDKYGEEKIKRDKRKESKTKWGKENTVNGRRSKFVGNFYQFILEFIWAKGYVRVAVDAGWEKIHKERKMQKAEFYSLSKGGKALGTEKFTSTRRLGLWVFIES